MRWIAAPLLALCLLAAPPAAAQISLLGLTNSLVQFALERISTPDSFEITAEGVESSEDGLLELVGVRIADGRGVWLEADALGVDWNARRILLGQLEIRRLEARGVRLRRLPEPASVAIEATAEPEEESGGFTWPRAPITTRIERLALRDVEIAEGVIAEQSLAFEATGSARDEGDEQAVELDITRTDSVEGEILLSYLRHFGDDRLELNLDAREGAGGIVAELAGFPEDTASDITVDATGPLSDWQVAFEAEAERVFQAAGSGSITLGPPFALDAQVAVTPGPALDPQVAAAIGERAELRARAREDADGFVIVEEGSIAAPDIAVTVDGRFGRNDGTLDGTVDLTIGGGLSNLVPDVAWDEIAFDGDVRGTLDDLEATGALSLTGLETAPADVGQATLDATLRRAGARFEASVSGVADDVRIDRIGPELMGRTDLALEAAYEGSQVTLNRLSVASPLLTAEAQGEADLAANTAQLGYALGTPDLAPIAGAYGVDAVGRLDAEGRLDGTLDAPRLDGTLALEDIAYAGQPYGRLALDHDVTLGTTPSGRVSLTSEGSPFGPAEVATDFRLDQSRLALTDLSADVLGVVAEGDVAVDLESTLAEGRVQARIADLQPLADYLDAPVTGEAEGVVDFAVESGTQTVALDVTAGNVTAPDTRLDRLTVDAMVRDALGSPSAEGRVLAEGVAAAGAEIGRLVLDGQASDLRDSPAADVTLEAEDIAAAGASVGRVQGTAQVRDTLGDTTAEVVLTAEDIAAAGATVASLTTEAQLRDLRGTPAADVTFTADTIAAAGATVDSARGEAQLSDLLDSPAVVASVTAERVAAGGATVATVAADADLQNLTGLPTGTAALRLSDIAAGGATVPQAQADLRLDEAEGALQAALDASVPTVALDGGRLGPVTLTATAADALGGNPALDARIDVGGGTVGTVEIAGAGLTAQGTLADMAIALEARATVDEQPAAVRAAATLDATDTGQIEAELTRLEANLGDFETRTTRPARVRLGAETAVKGFELALPGGALRAEARQAGGGAAARLDLELSDILPIAELAGLPLTGGALSTQLDLDTTGDSPRADATLTARRLALAGAEVGEASFDTDATLRWRGGRADSTVTASGPFGQPVEISLSIPLEQTTGGFPSIPQGGRLDGTLRWQGRIGDLWVLVPAPDHVLDGEVDADLAIGGTVASPTVGGDLTLRDGRYENLTLGTILTDLTVSSTIAPDGDFELDATASDGANGRVTAQAFIGNGDVEATVTADGAILVRRDEATAAVSLDIRAAGPLAGPDVSGRIGIDRAEVNLGAALPPSVADIGPVRIKGEEPPEEDGGAGSGIALDIAIEGERDIFVRGRGLDSEWRIDLAVGGTAANPEIVGVIERVRGVLNLVGFTFDLDTGEIRFTGATPVDPTLDIRILRENAGVRGGIYVSGVASDPDIGFRSVPSLPEDEVLPRVLFGSSQQSLTGTQALLIAGGVAELMGGSSLLEGVRSAVGVDVLRVEDDAEGGAEVTVGQNVADGVFVGAKQPLGGGSSKVVVEIEILDNLIADTELSGEDTSLGINWRREF
jgi:translocation and assembly module TamB